MTRSKNKPQADARTRAEVILKVQAGLMTASDAAKKLGVSRKTYYKWEKRGLEGMLKALSEKPSGRPSRPVDGEKDSLKNTIAQIEKQLMLTEQKHQIRTFLTEELDLIEAYRKKGSKKK